MRNRENWLAYWAGEFVILFGLVLILSFFTGAPAAKSWVGFVASLTGVRLLGAAVGALVGATIALLLRRLSSRRRR